MKARYLLISVMLMISGALGAQQRCDASAYMQQQLANDPTLRLKIASIEQFTQAKLNASATSR